MRYKRGHIDSLVLSDDNLEAIFIHHEDYSIQTVKSRSIFEPEIWKKAFSSPLSRNIIDARIVHNYLGAVLPLKTLASSPKVQRVEFAGLHGYNERSELLLVTLGELESQLQQSRVTRIDVCFDYDNGIPKNIIKALSKNREPFLWKNSVYWKTEKEKKTNPKMDIVTYNKALQVNLDYSLHRLEFRFKAGYLDSVSLGDIETMYKKMEKTIKRFAGITVKISAIPVK